MSFKRLTPDLSPHILAANQAADRIFKLAEELRAAMETVENNLQTLQREGGQAEKLDYCVKRAAELHIQWNVMEISSFHCITVKQVCAELWQKLP